MACHWRIRHKLILGLCLVVGILALLLAGTYKGLASYRDTINSIDSKLVELHHAQKLKEALKLPLEAKSSRADGPDEILERFKPARVELVAYQGALNDTLIRHRDPNRGYNETGLVEELNKKFGDLDRAIAGIKANPEARPLQGSDSLLDADPATRKAVFNLVLATDGLHAAIYDSLFDRITAAKSDCRTSLILVVATSVIGVLLMTSLLRFFYRWTFYPLRDLQLGVGRVAQGDFEHSIEIHSGDEMEELAAAFNDMTSRLRDMYRDLARQVNERSRQLVRSERLAGVGFLAAGVAHEINNPLASILFCSEALEARLADLLGAKPAPVTRPTLRMELRDPERETDREVVDKYLKMIQEQALRCKGITQRLLEFSRGGEKRREPANLADVVQSVLDMVQHLPVLKGKNIVYPPIPGGKLVAWVNAQEVQSVVVNLVINALESMDEGGTLTIGLKQRDGMAEMHFTDTGCGMNDEVLENIFEPFYTRSRTGTGTGLGLSISHRVITQHGGEIEASSPGVNQGSTFLVRIPLQPVESAQEDPPLRAAA
ncbi:MAG: HAMP domain-containing histidine kinase [Gemmataceae bacterium]|nr:HAMP domain-containing histidine kinase [Gemmataceae bacterium]